MTQPPPPERSTPEKRALLNAFDEVMRSEAARRTAEREARRRGTGRRGLFYALNAIVVAGLAAYVWLARPEWIFPPAAPRESAAVRDASLRMAIALQAERVERYRQARGRLPDSLSEAGAPLPGIRYRPVGDSAYALVGSAGGDTLTFRSTDPLRAFVGESYRTLGRGRTR